MYLQCVVLCLLTASFTHILYDKYAHYAVLQTSERIEYVIASHRSMCSDIADGCYIDTASICHMSSFPLVRCTWSGGVDAVDGIRFHSGYESGSSMGSFDLRLYSYNIRTNISFFGNAESSWHRNF